MLFFGISLASLVAWILFGALVGFLASLVGGGGRGLVGLIVIGILGSFVGGWLGHALGFRFDQGFNLMNVLFSVIGAMLVSAVGRAIFG